MSDELAAAANLIEIPEGAVPEFGITILSFIDAEGDRSYALASHGDPFLGELLGLMRLAEFALVEES